MEIIIIFNRIVILNKKYCTSFLKKNNEYFTSYYYINNELLKNKYSLSSLHLRVYTRRDTRISTQFNNIFHITVKTCAININY